MVVSSGSVWYQIVHNTVLVASATAWLIAQSLKVVIGAIEQRKFSFRWFVGSGGMPSSHTAFAVAAAVSIGLNQGFDSVLFACMAVFALVVMFDAQGVRQHSGKQAEALNKILDDIYAHRDVELEPLKELFGHTPVEVIAGAGIGVLVALLFA